VEYGLQKENPEFAEFKTFHYPNCKISKSKLYLPLQKKCEEVSGTVTLLFIFWTLCVKYRHFTLAILIFQLKGVYKN